MYVALYANLNSEMGHIPPGASSERGAFGNNEKRH